jgi:eukaryotic-like serine/threonine-protein kinase
MAFSLGETLQAGKYRLDAFIEQREWGITYLATHLTVDQPVLIKTFEATDTVNGPSRSQVDSYIRYAQTLTRFHYPQLSRVSSVFEEGNIACMVSEYVQGESLSQLIQDRPLDEPTALQYLFATAQGLHALHRHGLLHLNLRPSRILKRKEGGDIVLIGLNSRFSNHPDEHEGQPYLALEQYQSAAVDIASEVYGLAATLYTLVTGTVPMRAVDRSTTPLARPRQLCPNLSPSLEEAILKGLALDRRDRPQSLKAWLRLLPKLDLADPKTTIQVPPAWKVKLPAFREAGFENAVSTVITAAPVASNSAAKTTLQPQPSNPTLLQHVSTPEDLGHSELDAIFAEQSDKPPIPSVSQTTLQVTELPLGQSQVTPAPSRAEEAQPVSVVVPAPVQIPEVRDVVAPELWLEAKIPAATPFPEEAEAQSPSLSPSIPEPGLHPVTVPLPEPSDMTTAFPKQSSRFPKWALFWCALAAACGGLGAGLWFRVQIAQQFSFPGNTAEQSSLEQLKSLETKEEEFLPTKSSVIPTEKPAQTGDGDFNDPDELTDIELAPESDPESDPESIEPEVSIDQPVEARNLDQERLPQEFLDLSLEGEETESVPLELSSDDLESESLDQEAFEPASAPETPDFSLAPVPAPEEF